MLNAGNIERTLKEVKDIEEKQHITISEKILSLSTPEKLWQRTQELE